MKIRVLTVLLTCFCGGMPWCQPTQAEEGMYPMSNLANIDLAARGIELTATQLFNPDGTALVDGVCRVNGCTGSFVSGDGLIITNHHCAYGAIQRASTESRDLLSDGFNALTHEQEIPAPNYTVRVTENYSDVSAKVLEAVNGSMSYLERTQAIEQRCKEIEIQAEKQQPGLRAEVAEMFAGKSYVLFMYTYLKDIRLVFAPPQSVGNFGGEADNWMWPRHTGDFSFMRAYTAPDGSSAAHNAANVPYKPKRFVQVQPKGVQEDDAVFLLGYPGRTARHKTAAFLKYEETVRLPTIVDLYQWQIDVLSAAGEAGRDVQIKHASRMRSLANVEKRSRGQLKGLRRAQIAARRSAAEKQLQEFIAADPERQTDNGKLLDEIAGVYAEMSGAAPLEIHVAQLNRACRGIGLAHFVYEAALQRGLPDLERESAYTDRNLQQSIQRMRSSLQDYHLPTDITLLSGLLRRLQTIEGAPTLPGLEELLAIKPDLLRGEVSELLSASRLSGPDYFENCLGLEPAELESLDDPIMQLAVKMYPTMELQRQVAKAREGQLSQLYGSLIAVKQEFMATSFVPDANATLRFTCGYVRAYSPEDAVIKTPISTLSGVVDKTTGVSPFVTPEVVLEKYRQRDFGPFLNEELDDVPVAILYNTDTTGGNSGSPIFNARGELVGVNFDRCFEATINDFAWDESYSRSIGVDIRYVLWITGYVYEAKHLLTEMGVETR